MTKSVDVFLGNLDLGVTPEALLDYISDELNVNVMKCELLVSKYIENPSSKSFKVTLNISDRDKLLSPEAWPEDVICRKFYSARNARNPAHLKND